MENGLDVYAPATFDVYLNEFANLGNVLDFALFPDGSNGESRFALNATENLFSDNDTGIATYVRYSGSENYTHNSYVGENTFFSNAYDDYEVRFEGENPEGEIHAAIEVEGNLSLNGDTFVEIGVGRESGPGGARLGEEEGSILCGRFDFWIQGNDVIGTNEGIIIDGDGGPDTTTLIEHNEIIDTYEDDTAGDAIYVRIAGAGDTTDHSITINDNRIQNSAGDGIEVRVFDALDTALSIVDNELSDIENEAIEVNGAPYGF